MSFRRILVAVDTSPQAPMVFEQALEFAKKESASLMLFHCVELGAKLTYPSAIKEKTQKGEELVQSYQQKAQEQGITIESISQVGEAGKAICNLAESWGADLIMMGRRGCKGLTEVILGSVSNHVVHYAPCSVLVFQGENFNC